MHKTFVDLHLSWQAVYLIVQPPGLLAKIQFILLKKKAFLSHVGPEKSERFTSQQETKHSNIHILTLKAKLNTVTDDTKSKMCHLRLFKHIQCPT